MTKSISGFSLVELSIVLVILGLLTGGILTGQNLIRAAELRSVVTDYQKFHTAVMTFRGKYFHLPGDMPNAADFWGFAESSGIGSACYLVDSSTLSSSNATCNGNGDGDIGASQGCGTGSLCRYAERFRAWQHLANAGMIEGSYTGVTDSTTNSYLLSSRNSPISKIGGALYGIYRISSGSNPDFFPGTNVGGTELTLRLPATPSLSPLLPEELWQIDKKSDDGKPGTGKIYTHVKSSANAPDCSTSDDPGTAAYDVANKNVSCYAGFIID